MNYKRNTKYCESKSKLLDFILRTNTLTVKVSWQRGDEVKLNFLKIYEFYEVLVSFMSLWTNWIPLLYQNASAAPLVVVVVDWKDNHSGSVINRTGAESLSFYYPRLLYCPDQMLTVVVLYQHRVSSSKTVRPLASCGDRCMGHAIKTGSAVCSGARHSQIGERMRLHLCMDEWNHPTFVRKRLNLIQATPLMVYTGSDISLNESYTSGTTWSAKFDDFR